MRSSILQGHRRRAIIRDDVGLSVSVVLAVVLLATWAVRVLELPLDAGFLSFAG